MPLPQPPPQGALTPQREKAGPDHDCRAEQRPAIGHASDPQLQDLGAVGVGQLRGDIELFEVTVKYGEKYALKDVSFAVKGGTKNAIIGPTAAGKSQLLYLLTALIEPTVATIRECLGNLVYGEEEEELQHAVVKLLREKHQTLSIAASPAPPKVAQQIYFQATLTKMCLRYHQGEAMEKTLAWAESEVEGFMRT